MDTRYYSINIAFIALVANVIIIVHARFAMPVISVHLFVAIYSRCPQTMYAFVLPIPGWRSRYFVAPSCPCRLRFGLRRWGLVGCLGCSRLCSRWVKRRGCFRSRCTVHRLEWLSRFAHCCLLINLLWVFASWSSFDWGLAGPIQQTF